ncbi:MAG: type II toxin-antitoxin system HicA family toxin [Candidatus Daviesbacteria bacterium]|nr:type II toxin-antitoxin system HicA family toxin [Candidatus Daviesbacteria bacterium]
MARITPIHWQKLLKLFQAEGCVLVGQTGDHLELKKKGAKRRIVIPKYRDIPVFIIENNLKTAGISRKRYFELLKKV